MGEVLSDRWVGCSYIDNGIFYCLVVLGNKNIGMESPPGCEKKLYILLNKIFCLFGKHHRPLCTEGRWLIGN